MERFNKKELFHCYHYLNSLLSRLIYPFLVAFTSYKNSSYFLNCHPPWNYSASISWFYSHFLLIFYQSLLKLLALSSHFLVKHYFPFKWASILALLKLDNYSSEGIQNSFPDLRWMALSFVFHFLRPTYSPTLWFYFKVMLYHDEFLRTIPPIVWAFLYLLKIQVSWVTVERTLCLYLYLDIALDTRSISGGSYFKINY